MINRTLGVVGALLIAAPVLAGLIWQVPHGEPLPPLFNIVPGYTYPAEDKLSGWSDPRIVRRAGESELEFAKRASENIYKSTFHCAYDDDRQSWFTALASRLGMVDEQQMYGVLAIETFRCGFCHQRATLLARAMRNGGIESAFVLALDGHVVTGFRHDGRDYAADADYGIGPFETRWHDIAHLRETIENQYSGVRALFGDYVANIIVNAYLTTHNNGEYMTYDYMSNLMDRQSNVLRLERLVEVISFVAGAFLIACALYRSQRKRLDRRRQNPAPVAY